MAYEVVHCIICLLIVANAYDFVQKYGIFRVNDSQNEYHQIKLLRTDVSQKNHRRL